jgi:hypothetical protein
MNGRPSAGSGVRSDARIDQTGRFSIQGCHATGGLVIKGSWLEQARAKKPRKPEPQTPSLALSPSGAKSPRFLAARFVPALAAAADR